MKHLYLKSTIKSNMNKKLKFQTMKNSVLKTTLSVFLINIAFFMAICGGDAISQNGGSDAGPIFIANPNPLYFNDTYIASQSQQTLTFFNSGDADLVITQAIFDGPFETYNSFPITVPAGTPYDQVIHFKPFELGLIEGSVTYISNDPANPSLEVSLIGNCINDPINGWEWIYTGHNYILTDLDFPEGQDQIGYTVGQTVTYNGLGIVLKTTDGGDTWTSMTQYGIAGIERCSFPTLETGYAAGWTDDIMKTADGGQTWENIQVVSNVNYYACVEFKDVNNGIVLVHLTSGGDKVYFTSDGGASWTEGTGCEAFEDVTWAGGDTWYATGYEYVSKSTDNGATWTTVYSQGALLLGADFLTPDFGIACGDYGQVITTQDGGGTWEEDVILDWLFHKPFIWDNDTAYVVGTPEYIYKTTDAGQSWESDFDGNWMKAFYNITFTDNYTGFVCGGSNGIILRKKPGDVIAPVISATPNPLAFDDTSVGDTAEEILTVENTGNALLEVTNISSTSPYFSTDMTSFSVEPGASQEITVSFSPTSAGYAEGELRFANNSASNPYDVMVSGTGVATGPTPVFIANPNPLYWNDTYIASQSQQSLFFFNAGDAELEITGAVFDGPFETYNSFPITVAPGETFNQVIHFKPFELGLIEGSVTYSSDDPINPSLEVSLIGTCIDDPINGWEWIYTGYNYILTDIEFPEGQDMIGYTVGQSVTYNGLGIVLKTTDGGTNWVPMTQYGIDGIERASFPSLNIGYCAGWNDDIMKTTDGGQTWENLEVVSNVYYYSSIEFKDNDNGILLAKMNSGPFKTFITADGGDTWTEGTGNDAYEDVTWAGGDTWYTSGYSNVCKSTDGGATWTTVFSEGALLLGADFLTPDYGIAAGDYGQVITTKDGGETWETDVILDILFHKPFIWDNDTAYVVGTPEYVYKTTDAGQTWVSDFDGNWMKALYKVLFTDNYTGFICGGSNGIVLRKKPTIVECSNPWDVQVTGTVHTISVPVACNPNVNGEPLMEGDWVGVFYLDDNGNEVCGGAGAINPFGSAAVLAYGDDPLTPEKDGFALDERFIWRMYVCSDNMEYPAGATYDPGQPNQSLFEPMGQSKLTSLAVMECQYYTLNTGWNSISSYINPFTPNVEDLFAPIADDIILLRNLTQVYWPEEQINTIGDFNNGSGYALKLSADAEFAICGQDFATNEVMLETGWFYMPTLSQCPANTMDLFGDNLDDIIIVQDLIGTGIFWPAQGIFSLEYLEQGKAYKIKVANPFTVTFPGCNGKDATVPAFSPVNNINTIWGAMNMTPSTEVVAFTKSATADFIQGDVIGVFGQASQLFGYMAVTGTGAQAITLFGDDVTTIAQDGFIEGETVSYKLYRAQTGETFDLSVEYETAMDNTSGNFYAGSFAAIKSVTTGVTGIGTVEGSSIDVYPNPARNIINVDGMDMQKLVILNYHGQLVYQNDDPQTTNVLQTSRLPSGLYILKVETSTGVRFEKIVIEK